MYPGFKKKAMTFSYDDGIIEDKILIPLLKKYSFKGTFNLNSGQSGEKKIRESRIDGHEVDCSHLVLSDNVSLYDGMEVATHTYSHPFMETLSYEEQVQQIKKDKDNLESLFKKKVLGSAYPYGTYNTDTLKALNEEGIMYARTVKSTYDFYRPYNWLLWHPTIHHNDPRLNEIMDKFLSTDIELAILYIWGHSYEFAIQDNFPIVDQIGKKLSMKDDIYYATNIEICSYIKAAELVYYKKREEGFLVNPSSQDVYLVTSKGDKIVLHGKERLKYE